MIKNLLEDAEKFCNSNPDVMTAFKTGLRSGYIEGRNQENHRIMDKACEWLQQNTYTFFTCDTDEVLYFVNHFKEAMDGEE